MLLSIFIVILIMAGLFKLTGLLLRIVGAVLGAVLSIFGWLILAGLAVTVFGLATFVLPVIIIAGIAALFIGRAS